jgi:hypothetical protein
MTMFFCRDDVNQNRVVHHSPYSSKPAKGAIQDGEILVFYSVWLVGWFVGWRHRVLVVTPGGHTRLARCCCRRRCLFGGHSI